MISQDLIDIVFAFDTTGSMYSVLESVKSNISATAQRLFRDLPGLRVSVMSFGCYHDGPVRVMPFTGGESVVADYVRRVPSSRGGGAHACYELALEQAAELAWREEAKAKIVVVIGDEPPHEFSTLTEQGECWGNQWPWNNPRPARVTVDWVAKLKTIAARGIVVHGVQALGKHYASAFYDAISRATGGAYVTLDQFSEIEHLVLASCYRAAGEQELLGYVREVERKGELTRSVDRVFQALAGTSYVSRVKELPAGLVPVSPSRFQKFRVPSPKRGQDKKDARVKISDFVRERGLQFNLGKGFYELTKSVRVQSNKECLLEDRVTGDLFTGVAARRILKLPDGQDVTLNPKKLGDVGYRAYVQSTAENRLLEPDSVLPYEVNA